MALISKPVYEINPHPDGLHTFKLDILATLVVNVEKYIKNKTLSKHTGKKGQYCMKNPDFSSPA